ncbi:MAG: arginine--tRNA ligase, partial [Pseudomonadota bacterium]
WGLQIGQLIAQIEDEAPDLLEPEGKASLDMSDLQTWYPRASARSKDDQDFLDRARVATADLQAGQAAYMSLWQRIRDVSSQSLLRDYGRLGVSFDQWYGESRYQDDLEEITKDLLDEGTAEVNDGAVIIRMPDELDLPPLILQNSKGSFGYGSTDLATIADRLRHDDPDIILYVVDARQKTHFQQVFKAAERAGFLTKTHLEHIAFGTVNGTDGKPFKTRAGGVMRLQDLLDNMSAAAKVRLDEVGQITGPLSETVAEEIATAAIKFGELIHDRESNYVFDVEQFLRFEGKTGPYLQYSIVRLRSLLSRAADAGLNPGDLVEFDQRGRQLALRLGEFPATFERAVEKRKPNIIAHFAFDLANAANSFYQSNQILGSTTEDSVKRSHLRLLEAANHSLSVCCGLLGLAIPKEM